MKYSQFRIAILTCILGIVSVPFFNGLYEKWSEPFVDLPQVVSDTPIIVDVETERKPFNMAGGGGSGIRCTKHFLEDEIIPKKRKKFRKHK
jgi:hypothetical protein